MLLSSYALLIDVPFLNHAHNLFLEIWIEQGVIGFIAFLWIVAEYYWYLWTHRTTLNYISIGGAIATSLLLVHGLTDAPLYVSRGLPLLFVPIGFTFAAFSPPSRHKSFSLASFLQRPNPVSLAVGVGLMIVIVVVILTTWDHLWATWEANLGSVEEARTELGNFDSSRRQVMAVRRDTDLSTAENFFELSLRTEPFNAVANRRLGMIRLAKMNIDDAIPYLEQSWSSDPDSRATRKALGYAYAWDGDYKRAAELLSPLREAGGEMETYSWWWGTQGKPDLAKRAAVMAQRLRSFQ